MSTVRLYCASAHSRRTIAWAKPRDGAAIGAVQPLEVVIESHKWLSHGGGGELTPPTMRVTNISTLDNQRVEMPVTTLVDPGLIDGNGVDTYLQVEFICPICGPPRATRRRLRQVRIALAGTLNQSNGVLAVDFRELDRIAASV